MTSSMRDDLNKIDEMAPTTYLVVLDLICGEATNFELCVDVRAGKSTNTEDIEQLSLDATKT